ncbi:MAG TPA: hypothetical protein VGR37_01060 [Longimicrobiaceae bacterium]|nr:hypothetical protein [Longimicrobiaceae bacterium]
MRTAGTVLLLLTVSLLTAGCGTQSLVAPDRPAFDGGGYLGGGGSADVASDTSAQGDTVTASGFGGGYIGAGGGAEAGPDTSAQGDTVTVYGAGIGYLGGGG